MKSKLSKKSKVSKTANGEILVLEKPGFVASFVKGEWVQKLLFNAHDMNSVLLPVKDKKEAERLCREAHEALKTKNF
jgi:hypothetical protein